MGKQKKQPKKRHKKPMKPKRLNLADAKGLEAHILDGLGQAAAKRQALRDAGYEVGADTWKRIERLRWLLRENGVPQEQIDAIPGLEPLEPGLERLGPGLEPPEE